MAEVEKSPDMSGGIQPIKLGTVQEHSGAVFNLIAVNLKQNMRGVEDLVFLKTTNADPSHSSNILSCVPCLLKVGKRDLGGLFFVFYVHKIQINNFQRVVKSRSSVLQNFFFKKRPFIAHQIQNLLHWSRLPLLPLPLVLQFQVQAP